MTNLKYLLEGKKLLSVEGNIYTLSGISICDGAETKTVSIEAIEEEYELYQTEEELEIERLKGIIEKQNQVIQDLSKPKGRKTHKSLDPDEIEDMETQFKLGTKQIDIADMFGVSPSFICKKRKEWENNVNSN